MRHVPKHTSNHGGECHNLGIRVVPWINTTALENTYSKPNV